jgi:predicted ATPase
MARMLDDARLVTVLGPGGVGKTRVALAAAAGAVDGYPDGVWIVELSGLRDPALLANTVASALGLIEQDIRPPLDTLLAFLRDRRMLLIFDTCEHIVDACADLVAKILAAAPAVSVLATSRQPLDAEGEHTYQVAPLPVPDTGDAGLDGTGPGDRGPGGTGPGGTGPAGAGPGIGDAVELFTLRASAVTGGFGVTDRNWADVSRICRRLDGIPLAIELAAVRLRTMKLPDLARRLDQTFMILAREGHGPLDRHETLNAAIEWSHHLCTGAERRLWARLSVFAGTFDIRAVEETCAETELEREEVVAALIGLVDKSVVLRHPADDSRYLLLDTLREFGAGQLAASGEVTACRDRHLARYLRVARYFGAHFTDDDQLARFHALRWDHANIRAALEWALGIHHRAFRTVEGAELATALYGYWQISGQLREGDYWLSKVLDQFPGPSAQRAKALVNRGFVRSFEGHLAEALADCGEGTDLALALGERGIAARGYLHLTLTLTFTGEHEQAAAAGAAARRMLTECGDRPGLLMLAPQLAHLNQLAGDLDRALRMCEWGLEMLGPGSGEHWVQSYVYTVAGLTLFRMPGRQADCAVMVRKGLLAKQELGDLIGIAYALEVLAWLAARTGECDRAAWLFGAADPLWQRCGSRFSGTAIMEESHQKAVQAAWSALGPDRYADLHAQGTTHAKEQLASLSPGHPLAIRIP